MKDLRDSIQLRSKIINYEIWRRFEQFNKKSKHDNQSNFRQRIAESYILNSDTLTKVGQYCESLSQDNLTQTLNQYVEDIMHTPKNIQSRIFFIIQYAQEQYDKHIKNKSQMDQILTSLTNYLIENLNVLLNNLQSTSRSSREFLNQQLKDCSNKQGIHQLNESRQRRRRNKCQQTLNDRVKYIKSYRVSKQYNFFMKVYLKIVKFIQKSYFLLRKCSLSNSFFQEIFYVFLKRNKPFPQMLLDFKKVISNYFTQNIPFYLNIESQLYDLFTNSRILLRQNIQNERKVIVFFNLIVAVLKAMCKKNLYIFAHQMCQSIEKILEIIPYSIKNTEQYNKLLLSFNYYKGFSQTNFDVNHKFKDYMTCKKLFYHLLYYDFPHINRNQIDYESTSYKGSSFDLNEQPSIDIIQSQSCFNQHYITSNQPQIYPKEQSISFINQSFNLNLNETSINFNDSSIFKENHINIFDGFMAKQNKIRVNNKMKRKSKKKNTQQILQRSNQDFFKNFFLCYMFFRQEDNNIDRDRQKSLLKESIRIYKMNPNFDLGMSQISQSFQFQDLITYKECLKAIRYMMYKEKIVKYVDSTKQTIYERYNFAAKEEIISCLLKDRERKQQVVKYLKLLADIHIYNGEEIPFLNIWRYLSLLDDSLYMRFLMYHDQLEWYNNQSHNVEDQIIIYQQIADEIKEERKTMSEQNNTFYELTYTNQKYLFANDILQYQHINIQKDTPIISIRKIMSNLIKEIRESMDKKEDTFYRLFNVPSSSFLNIHEGKINQQDFKNQNISFTTRFRFNEHDIFMKVFSLKRSRNCSKDGNITYQFDYDFYSYIQEIAIGMYLRKKQHQTDQTFSSNIGYHTFVRYIYHFVQDHRIFLILENCSIQSDQILTMHFAQAEKTQDAAKDERQIQLEKDNSLGSITLSLSSIQSLEMTIDSDTILQKDNLLIQLKSCTTEDSSQQSSMIDNLLKHNNTSNLSDSPSFQIIQSSDDVISSQDSINSLTFIENQSNYLNTTCQKEIASSYISQEGSYFQQCNSSNITQEVSLTINSQSNTLTNSSIVQTKNESEIELSNSMTFNSEQLFLCFLQLEQGFNLLGENCILHRDIKLDNTVFRSRDEPVIIDFGVSELFLDFSYNMSNAGTPQYRSYQQNEGQPVNENTDLTALIITQYELTRGSKIVIYEDSGMFSKAQYISRHAHEELKDIFSEDFIHLIAMVVDCQLDTMKSKGKYFMWQKFEIFINLIYQCLDSATQCTYQAFYQIIKQTIFKRVICKTKFKLYKEFNNDTKTLFTGIQSIKDNKQQNKIKFNVKKLRELARNKVFCMLVSLQSHDILKMYESILFISIQQENMELYYLQKDIITTKHTSLSTSITDDIIKDSTFSLITLISHNTATSSSSFIIESDKSINTISSTYYLRQEDIFNHERKSIKEIIIIESYKCLDQNQEYPSVDNFKKDMNEYFDNKQFSQIIHNKRYIFHIDKLINAYEMFDLKQISIDEQKQAQKIFLKLIKIAYSQCTIIQLSQIMEETQKEIFQFQHTTNLKINKAYNSTDSIRKEIKQKLRSSPIQNIINNTYLINQHSTYHKEQDQQLQQLYSQEITQGNKSLNINKHSKQLSNNSSKQQSLNQQEQFISSSSKITFDNQQNKGQVDRTQKKFKLKKFEENQTIKMN